MIFSQVFGKITEIRYTSDYPLKISESAFQQLTNSGDYHVKQEFHCQNLLTIINARGLHQECIFWEYL